ncbi:MAG: hypothetical protein JOZ16_15980 [Methylobacteriaceae bacterium]|nr:hypothetical protein [Methylobacteriaceae bacterium]
MSDPECIKSKDGSQGTGADALIKHLEKKRRSIQRQNRNRERLLWIASLRSQ